MSETVRGVAKVEATRWIIAVLFAVIMVVAQRMASSPDFRETVKGYARRFLLPVRIHRRQPSPPEITAMHREAEGILRGADDA